MECGNITALRAPVSQIENSRGAESFALEKDIRGRSAEERRLTRQQRGRPLADAFQKWLRRKRGLISQKGQLADAIRYALSRWKGLTRFLDDGRIKLDDCPVESSIRLLS